MTFPGHEDIAREVQAEWDSFCTSRGDQRDDNRKRNESRAIKKSAKVLERLVQENRVVEDTSDEQATKAVCGFLPAWIFLQLGSAIISFFVQRALRRYFASRQSH